LNFFCREKTRFWLKKKCHHHLQSPSVIVRKQDKNRQQKKKKKRKKNSLKRLHYLPSLNRLSFSLKDKQPIVSRSLDALRTLNINLKNNLFKYSSFPNSEIVLCLLLIDRNK
jgi:hypothetical protein